MMPAIAATIWLGVGVLLLATNRDVCSPAKIVYAYALVFFLGFYFSTDSEVVGLTYIIILVLIGVMGMYESLHLRDLGMPFRLRRAETVLSAKQAATVITAVWVLSSLPLLAQAYLIQALGGPASYVANLAFRVKEFAGFGPLLSVIKILPVLSILYFATIVTSAKSTLLSKALFVLHLILTLSIGLLSGSRSLVLMNFFWMILVWNNLRRPFSTKGIVALGVSLVAAGFILGTARDAVSYSGISQGNFSDSNLEQVLTSTGKKFGRSATANSGLEGLRLVLDAGVRDPQYGLTFLTGLTNFVPRAIWPDKPRTGGVVLTQDYTGDAWGGYSNLSTGIFAESMINFGLIPGFAWGLLLLFGLFAWLCRLYRNTVAAPQKRPALQAVISNIRYIFILQFVAGLLLGEFANLFVNLVLQLLIIAAIGLFIRILDWHRIDRRAFS